MSYVRFAVALPLLAATASLLTACPRPLGYQGIRMYPNVVLEGAVAMVFVPGTTTALIASQDGRVHSIDTSDPDAEPQLYLDISDRLIDDPSDEEGLLGIALAPDFATSRTFYLHYTAGRPRRTVIASYIADGQLGDRRRSEQSVLQQPQPYNNHNGGAIVFGPDGYLYIALGDGGGVGDPDGNGQDPDDLFGAILRIAPYRNGYTIPPDNPFVGAPGRDEVWAWGLRNPWRISFDRATGDLWAGDVGQQDWEEVNRIVRGGNYGWNATEGFGCFRGGECDPSQYIPPRAVFETHDDDGSCAIIGGYVYRGKAMPELAGWYIYGDFCTGRIWAANAASDTGDPVQLLDGRSPMTSFAEDAGGEIYILSLGGGIYRLAPK